MAVSLELLKEIAAITYNDDDAQLQLFLDSSREQVERYTNVSMMAREVELAVEAHGKLTTRLYPITSITGATRSEICGFDTIIYAPNGTAVTVNVGDANNKTLEDAVYRLALSRYDNKEVHRAELPYNVQWEINQFRRDSFID